MSDSESGPTVVSAAALTDTGRVRNNNEDFVAYRVPEQNNTARLRMGRSFSYATVWAAVCRRSRQ